MKNSLKNRGFAFILTTFILSFGNAVKAEFNEVVIGQSLNDVGFLNQDINGDGTDDFKFEIIELSANIYTARVTSLGMSSFMDKSVTGFPDALDFGEAVSGPFINGNGVLGMSSSNSHFNGAGDKYLGVSISAGGDSYIGWILINCNLSNDSLTIIRAAYNTISNESILAGETNDNVSIQEDESYISIYPNPATDFLKISNTNENTGLSYSIHDLQGTTICNGIYENQIDISTIPYGVYFIIINNQGVISKEKIILAAN